MDELRKLFKVFIEKLKGKYEGDLAEPTAADDANVLRLMKLSGKDITILLDDELTSEAELSANAVPDDYKAEIVE